jgi:hypothetical protein
VEPPKPGDRRWIIAFVGAVAALAAGVLVANLVTKGAKTPPGNKTTIAEAAPRGRPDVQSPAHVVAAPMTASPKPAPSGSPSKLPSQPPSSPTNPGAQSRPPTQTAPGAPPTQAPAAPPPLAETPPAEAPPERPRALQLPSPYAAPPGESTDIEPENGLTRATACNRSSDTILVSAMHMAVGDQIFWKSSGYWRLNPGQCRAMFNTQNDVYYLHADRVVGDEIMPILAQSGQKGCLVNGKPYSFTLPRRILRCPYGAEVSQFVVVRTDRGASDSTYDFH